MKIQRRIPVLIFATICIVVTGCAPQQSAAQNAQARDTLFQVSTINSLMAGNYDGIKSIRDVSQKGDIGIGTFDGLDGEMVMIDGTTYQVKDSGVVEKPGLDVMLPFSTVTFFDEDAAQTVGPIKNLDDLKAVLDSMITKKDRFYAFRVDGTFSKVQVRSVPKQEKPYPILSEVTKKQAVFNYENVSGSLIGFWCPETVGTLNVPGYHLHFISDDRTRGGHLLDVKFVTAKAIADETRFFEMEIGVAGAQSGNLEDARKEIDKVEK